MARTTASEVKILLDNSTIDDTIVDNYITSANIMTTAVVGTSGLGTTILEEIERWLTAHMIAITRLRQAKKEEVGKAKIEYTGVYGKQLEMTSYGQMVLLLDTSNSFTSLGKQNASIYAIPGYNNRGE